MGYNGIQCLTLTAWYDTWICPKTADTLDAMAISQWDDDEPLDLGAPHFEKQTRVESKSLKFLKNQVVKLYPIISKYIPMISMLLVKKTMKYVDQKWWKTINEPINDSSIYSQLTIELPSTTNFVALTCTEPINVKKNKQKMCVYIYIYKETINRIG